MKIAMSYDGFLVCSPFGDLAKSEKARIVFSDLDLTQKNTDSWMHISCSYSFMEQKVEATLYKNGTMYKYEKDLSIYDETRYISPDHYLLILNNDQSNFHGS